MSFLYIVSVFVTNKHFYKHLAQKVYVVYVYHSSESIFSTCKWWWVGGI